VASVNKTLTGKMFLLKKSLHAKRNTCQDIEMKEFSADIARYRAMGDHGKELWMNPAVWAIGCYRFGNWLNVARPTWIIRVLLKPVAYLANKFCEVFMEMCIDSSATIGGGLFIAHIGGIHINPQAVLGKNCDIAHRVTIGTSAMGRKGAPTLGDEVYVGTGATLVGKIKIGSGAKIAANTLVMTNVPAGATVMGVPGRVIMQPPKVMAAVATVEAEMTDAK
jgi:serine O-acetyltransferase